MEDGPTPEELQAEAEARVEETDPPALANQYANALLTLAKAYTAQNLTGEAEEALDATITAVATRAADELTPFYKQEQN